MPPEHNCNLENICLMLEGTLKSILIAYQENPEKIPDICECALKTAKKMQKKALEG